MEEEEEDDPDVNDRSSPLIFSHRRNWIYVLSLRTTHGKAAAAVESCWAGEEEDRDNDSNQHFILVISGYQRGEIRNEDVFERSAPVSSSPNINIVTRKEEEEEDFNSNQNGFNLSTDHLQENVSISQWFWINFWELNKTSKSWAQ